MRISFENLELSRLCFLTGLAEASLKLEEKKDTANERRDLAKRLCNKFRGYSVLVDLSEKERSFLTSLIADFLLAHIRAVEEGKTQKDNYLVNELQAMLEKLSKGIENGSTAS